VDEPVVVFFGWIVNLILLALFRRHSCSLEVKDYETFTRKRANKRCTYV